MKSLKDDHRMPFQPMDESPGGQGGLNGRTSKIGSKPRNRKKRPEYENLSDICDNKTVGDD
jgi:hypothetical protein